MSDVQGIKIIDSENLDDKLNPVVINWTTPLVQRLPI